MSAKLLGLVSGAAVLAFSISAAPATALANVENDAGWNLTLQVNEGGTFSGVVAAPEVLSASEIPSALRLTDWMFTYAPSQQSAVGQFTLDSTNSNVEVLYFDSSSHNGSELEVVIRICCVTV